MSRTLPDLVDPLRLVEHDAELEGSLPVASMARLAADLVDSEGTVDVRLRFHRDPDGRPVASGRIRADLTVECQRCLEPVTVSVDVALSACFISKEEACDKLPDGLEPVLVGDRPWRLTALVEDELLLALPMVPSHAYRTCGAAVSGRVDDEGGDGSRRPFKDLKNLLGSR